MKDKNKDKNKYAPKTGIRKQFRNVNDKKTKGHPAYIYAIVGKEAKFVGITHAKITDGMNNIELEKNPNPNDKNKAYIRPKTGKAHKSALGKRLEKWRFSEKDKEKVNEVIKKDKKE